jgi:hypothetical protein
MPHRVIGPVLGALTALLIAAPTAHAQDPAPGLQDLVGARGSSGEQALQQRGYTFIKGEKSGSDSYTYYRQERSGQCIIVRTAEGRYQSLVTAPDFDCQNGASTAAAPHKEPGAHERQRFATVCGVIVDGKIYRYKCRVNGAAPGGRGKTVLHYPDQKVTLHWRQGDRVGVEFEGMKVLPTTFNTAEGETQFLFEGKTYFYISDPGMAEMEVQHFRE